MQDCVVRRMKPTFIMLEQMCSAAFSMDTVLAANATD